MASISGIAQGAGAIMSSVATLAQQKIMGGSIKNTADGNEGDASSIQDNDVASYQAMSKKATANMRAQAETDMQSSAAAARIQGEKSLTNAISGMIKDGAKATADMMKSA